MCLLLSKGDVISEKNQFYQRDTLFVKGDLLTIRNRTRNQSYSQTQRTVMISNSWLLVQVPNIC